MARYHTLTHDGCETSTTVVVARGEVLSVRAHVPQYGPRRGRLADVVIDLDEQVYWDGDDLLVVPCPSCDYEDSLEVSQS